MKSKKGSGILMFLLVLCILVGSLYYFRDDLNFKGSTIESFENDQISKELCVLSACNCECYRAGEEPEINLGKVCTKDCRAWENIDGCEFKNNTCQKVYKRNSGVLTRQLFHLGDRYVPTDRVEVTSGFFEYSGYNVDDTTDDTARGFEIWIKKGDPSRVLVKKETLFHVWVLDNDPYQLENNQE